ncbi:MAG: hypothetical protein ACPLW8_07120 [Candidatus Bathyarchaeales archaeon]
MSLREAYKTGNLKTVYEGRRFSIRMKLPGMSGWQVQEQIDELNEFLNDLRAEIAECREAIRQLKRKEEPEAACQKFRIFSPMYDVKYAIRRFEEEIARRKEIIKWVRRERQIYLMEKAKRKIAAVRLPIMRRRLKGLNEEAYKLLCEMKGSAERLSRLIAAYQKTTGKFNLLRDKFEKLTFTREPPFEGRIWVNMPVPKELKELKFFMDLEVES